MKFSVLHADGSGDDVGLEGLSDLYDELLTADEEHGDVSVIDDATGWCLSAHRGGQLIFGHLRDGGERHMFPVAKERVLELWRRLGEGDVEGLLKEPWKPGYQP